jgi:hypothetical protein
LGRDGHPVHLDDLCALKLKSATVMHDRGEGSADDDRDAG